MTESISAFPDAVGKSLVARRRIEALLKATHGLSDYKLVLKKGEPFTPVVLRVHPDPISIIGKVLEQNPKAYANIQDLVDTGISMVEAGLTVKDKNGHSTLTTEEEPAQVSMAEKRIAAMCIDVALSDDDFETAYSYVVNRLGATPGALSTSTSSLASSAVGRQAADEWSWKAALQAGKYKRNAKTSRPTHLGTSSANPEIRHLEQRLECLATALRIAPAPTLQEILNAFRRAEEELDAAVKAEAARENAWDDAGDEMLMPGGFNSTAAGLAAGRQRSAAATADEDAPRSLFDLSRATAAAAQRNLAALSSLQRSGQDRGVEETERALDGGEPRVRKRDQFRDAAVGTLTSGVGWLIGAPAVDRSREGG
jgi:protein transport protein SEC39